MNEKGNSTLFYLLILSMLALLGVSYIKFKRDQIKDLKSKQEVFLCAKKVNGLSQSYIERINQINNALKLLTTGEKLTWIIPGINIVGKLGTKATIKILKTTQNAFTVKFAKELVLTPTFCHIQKSNFKLPFLQKRNHFNQLIRRDPIWKISVYSKYYLIKSQIRLKDLKTYSRIKRDISFLKPLFF